MRERLILLIDDEADLRDAVATALRTEGLTVEVAADGAEAVRSARALEPAVIVVDLGLPRIDGWDVIRNLRRTSARFRPHIIVMSGFADARSRQLAFEAGCDEYIVKTVGVLGLVRAVQARLTRAWSASV